MAADKLVTIKRATLLLPTRQEGSLVEGQALVRSQLVVELEEDKEAQTMPITRAKRCCVETEVGAESKVERSKRIGVREGK